MTTGHFGMPRVILAGMMLAAALIPSASALSADNPKDQAKPAAPVNPIIEIESRFSPAQRKYLELLRHLVGQGRTPNILVQTCDQRFPNDRDQHRQALANWNAKNQAVVEELEKRRAVVVGIRARGNLVQRADMERAFNANVAKSAMVLFSETDPSKSRDLCGNLSSVLASEYYDLEPASDDAMNASLIKLMRAVSPVQIEAWYVQ
ncbi:hypothetical protein [Steroidobacter sp.]|uniref:hypothetical protein n=1 Tax=Steroidobacter sp. TaxID=1978227 RepID=UPI001A60AF5D|nr:hypothetical protein [Steroidobacter sp.]MBL8266024.1 hypothetical protein [Steroidobacter sp.]